MGISPIYRDAIYRTRSAGLDISRYIGLTRHTSMNQEWTMKYFQHISHISHFTVYCSALLNSLLFVAATSLLQCSYNFFNIIWPLLLLSNFGTHRDTALCLTLYLSLLLSTAQTNTFPCFQFRMNSSVTT